DDYVKNGAKSIASKAFTGKSYYLAVDEKKYKIYFYIPTADYGMPDSVLFISYDIKKINRRLHNLYAQAALLIIVVSLIHLLFALLLFKVIIRPVKVLNQKSREIAAGNLSARVALKRDDEFGELSASFDCMAVSIDEKVDELNKQMTALTEANRRIELMAVTDELTGLFNRHYFFEKLGLEIERSKRHKTPLGLIMIDIDHFKKFNDTYGHQVGDLVLKNVAKAVTASCRTIDVVGRYGGEEIAVIAPDCPEKFIGLFAERIRRNVANLKMSNNNETLSVTISLGTACMESSVVDSIKKAGSLLIYLADCALYSAKEKGRNRVVIG
ncbi:MAG TPA: diguanylate cyclase, partial [Spirochaetota bacterium]